MKTQHLRFDRTIVLDDMDPARFCFLRAKRGDCGWNSSLDRLYAYPPELRGGKGTIAIDHDPDRARPWMVYATFAVVDRNGDSSSRPDAKRYFKHPRAAFRAFRQEVRDARQG